MTAEMIDVTIYVLLDENGNFVFAADENELGDKYDDEVGEGAGLARRIFRIFQVTLSVPLPKTMVLTGTIPAKPNEAVLTIRE
jgi:hypothetical protein